MILKKLVQGILCVSASLSLAACGNADLTASIQEFVRTLNLPGVTVTNNGINVEVPTTTLSRTPSTGLVAEGAAVTITLNASPLEYAARAQIPFTITGNGITLDDILSMTVNGTTIPVALTGNFIATGETLALKTSTLVINLKADSKTEGTETLNVSISNRPEITVSVEIDDRSVAAVAPTTPTTAGTVLVQETNLVYEGAFRFPNMPYTGQVCDGFSYGGAGFTFNPAGNNGAGSLLATGHTYCSRVAEFTIPTPVKTTTVTSLPYSQLVANQPSKLVDALEGKISTSGVTGGTHNTVNGLAVYNGSLILTLGNHYTTVDQPVSHFIRPLSLATTGQVSAARRVVGNGINNARFTSGYMCAVPPELQAKFGGPLATGWVPGSIVSNASNGPSLFAFDPDRLKTESTIVAKTLLAYPVSNPLEASVSGQKQTVWNWTSDPPGCAIPNGTDSVLFIGRHGTGVFYYGVGGANGYATGGTSAAIYDPADNSTGEHAWPYIYQVWAYKSSDLVRVAAGEIQPWTVKPYAVWKLSLPFENVAGNHGTGGMAYDPKTRRLYLIQSAAGAYGEPVIQVFTVNNAVAPN